MNTIDRLMKRRHITDTGCWEYNGARDKKGYGRIRTARGSMLAHRVGYDLIVGGLAPSDLLCHTCDNPACFNPEHLFKGSNQDNTSDAVVKGRMGKLQDTDVAEIRVRLDRGDRQSHIAADYGVSAVLVHYIKHGKRRTA